MDDHPFAALAGMWRGEGAGSYPTIDDFEYVEELQIEPIPGRPIAHWRSRTRDATTGEPRHAESGFLRATAEGVEFVVAHNFGIVESATGSLDGGTLTLVSHGVHGTPTAKQIDQIERRVERTGDTLTYTIAMAAVGVMLTHHLRAALERATEA